MFSLKICCLVLLVLCFQQEICSGFNRLREFSRLIDEKENQGLFKKELRWVTPEFTSPCKGGNPPDLDKPAGKFPIAVKHIFCGEIEGTSAQGFHVIPKGIQLSKTPTNYDLKYARITGLRSPEHGKKSSVADGIEIKSGSGWIAKKKDGIEHFHFFPNLLSTENIYALLRGAQKHCNLNDGHKTIKANYNPLNVMNICFVMYVQKLPKHGSVYAITTAYAVALTQCNGLNVCTYVHK